MTGQESRTKSTKLGWSYFERQQGAEQEPQIQLMRKRRPKKSYNGSCRNSYEQLRALPGALVVAVGFLSLGSEFALAADKSVRQIVEILHKTPDGAAPDLSQLDLSFLDFSDLDFKAANLAGTKLHAADLTGANFSKADLTNAVLDRATIVKTNFSNANLQGAKIRLPHSAGGPGFDRKASTQFANANLSSARLFGRFDGVDFRNANLTETNLGPYGDWTQNTQSRRSVMTGANFTSAVLTRANLVEAILRFANFENADLSDADLSGADLTGAKFKGAVLTGANISGANLENVDLTKSSGVSKIIGLERARNLKSMRTQK